MDELSSVCIGASLGGSALFRKAQMPSKSSDTSLMKKGALQIVSENLRALMVHAGIVNARGEPNQSGMKRAHNIDQRTVGRILSCEMNLSVQKLDEVAHAFGLRAWQLLIPDLDPKNPPVFVMSEAERAFYRRLDELRAAEPPVPKYHMQ